MEELVKLEEERRNAGALLTGIQEQRERNDKKHRWKDIMQMLPGKAAVSPGVASNEMCAFLIINISSLQLISVNMIAYRSQYGSVNPAAVVGPGIVATAVSTLAAIIFCKIMDRKRRV